MDFISAGQQADVYKVYNVDRNQMMAMKHLYGNYSTNPKLFYRKIKILSQFPSPHRCLVWPIKVGAYDTETASFAYLMDLLPSGYQPIAIAMKKKNTLTIEQRKQLSIQMAEAFSVLHSNNFIYGDISGNNVQYCVDNNGDVHICIIDCDNISIQGQSLGLLGTGLFRSPEVLLGSAPTTFSDAHALAVAVFRLLVGEHPLDGKATHSIPYTPEMVQEYFGKHPEYIFSGSGLNEPTNEIYEERFHQLSKQLQLYFNVMFCNDCLHNNAKRPNVEMLLKILNM